jgi:beta-galactosidase
LKRRVLSPSEGSMPRIRLQFAITIFLNFWFLSNSSRAAPPTKFEIGPDSFLLNGKPFQIISGEMHYPRIPPEYWRQRIHMARAMGLNAITIYCFWNIHEPEPGQWNFKGFGDVAAFCRIAQDEGLYVIVRPGPYVCAEWDFGGFPAWLLRTPTMKVRSQDPDYTRFADDYVHHLAEQLARLQITRGGPIIMVQLENEYGSYGKDKVYLAHLRDTLKNAGFEVPLFTADGGGNMMKSGNLDGVLPGLNGGSGESVFKEIQKYRPTGPYFVPEFYPGCGKKFQLAARSQYLGQSVHVPRRNQLGRYERRQLRWALSTATHQLRLRCSAG